MEKYEVIQQRIEKLKKIARGYEREIKFYDRFPITSAIKMGILGGLPTLYLTESPIWGLVVGIGAGLMGFLLGKTTVEEKAKKEIGQDRLHAPEIQKYLLDHKAERCRGLISALEKELVCCQDYLPNQN